MSVAQQPVVVVGDRARRPGPPPTQWYARRPFLALLLVLLGVATWLLSPQAFSSAGGPGAGWQDPLVPDEAVLLDLGAGVDRDVELLQVRPRVSGGPSRAVRVAVCDRAAEVGTARGLLPDGCDWVAERPLLRATAEDPAGAEHLVLVVDPVPGATLVLDGADVLYRDGFRTGYQHVGGEHTVPFAPAG